MAQREDVSPLAVSGAMTLLTLSRMQTVAQGALSSVRVAGRLFDRHVFDHYESALAEIARARTVRHAARNERHRTLTRCGIISRATSRRSPKTCFPASCWDRAGRPCAAGWGHGANLAGCRQRPTARTAPLVSSAVTIRISSHALASLARPDWSPWQS